MFARKRNSQKRGGEWQRTKLDEQLLRSEKDGIDAIALGEALERLRLQDERAYYVFEFRHYRYTYAEIAALVPIVRRQPFSIIWWVPVGMLKMVARAMDAARPRSARLFFRGV